jgi:copper homeostasis protein (lipoprotein)
MHRSVCTLTLIACALSSGLGACTSASTSAAAPPTPTNPAPADNSANALDWAGVYLGTLPCDDCQGIETALLIRPDGSFQLATKSLGKPGELRVQHGVIVWNAARNQITLSGVTDAPSRYLVGEQQLVQLDAAGQRITGALADRYVLRKQLPAGRPRMER